MRRVRIAAAGFVLAAGFYLVLIDTVELPELYAGAGVVVGQGFTVNVSLVSSRTRSGREPR